MSVREQMLQAMIEISEGSGKVAPKLEEKLIGREPESIIIEARPKQTPEPSIDSSEDRTCDNWGAMREKGSAFGRCVLVVVLCHRALQPEARIRLRALEERYIDQWPAEEGRERPWNSDRLAARRSCGAASIPPPCRQNCVFAKQSPSFPVSRSLTLCRIPD